jgi:CheY-like chemotaxis protein
MEAKYRPKVSIILGDSQSENRQVLRNALSHEGYRMVRDFGRVSMIREALEKTLPDLLICDVRMADGDTCDLVDEVRHNMVGMNPFLPVIFFTWEADSDIVRKAVNSGADDLLAAPISPAKLFSRIESLVGARKPFVVTSDYIGPDRRKDRGDGEESKIPHFEVPNTLRAKATGVTIDVTKLQGAIDNAVYKMNEEKMVRHSYQISFLVGIIAPAYLEKKVGPEIEAHIARLSDVANDIGARLAGSSFEHVAELCTSLIRVGSAIRDDPQNADPKDIALLKPLSDSILASFNPDKDSALMAGEITEMVRKFAGRASAEALRQANTG